jgi:hypothetical protein
VPAWIATRLFANKAFVLSMNATVLGIAPVVRTFEEFVCPTCNDLGQFTPQERLNLLKGKIFKVGFNEVLCIAMPS